MCDQLHILMLISHTRWGAWSTSFIGYSWPLASVIQWVGPAALQVCTPCFAPFIQSVGPAALRRGLYKQCIGHMSGHLSSPFIGKGICSEQTLDRQN